MIFGSCRVALPHHPPYTLPKDEDERGREADAPHAGVVDVGVGARSMAELVLLLEIRCTRTRFRRRHGSSSTRDGIRPGLRGRRWPTSRSTRALYWESWGDPVIRWLFSTVSIAMVFDDRDMHDDWNISRSWLEEMSQQPWWEERAVSGLMSYWIYQFIGNLSPRELENSLYRQVREQEDAGPALREYAAKENQEGLLELLPRPRLEPADRGGFTGRAGAGGRSSVDLRRGGMGLDPGQGAGRLRPLADRYLGSIPAGARPALPGGLERGGLRWRLGRVGGKRRRADEARAGLRSLGRLPALVRAAPTC